MLHETVPTDEILGEIFRDCEPIAAALYILEEINNEKNERPAKYWFSYTLNKYLEPIAMKGCDGLISVSEAYIVELRNRYANLISKPASVITFGAFAKDLEIADGLKNKSDFFENNSANWLKVP